jgi:hypothetical protein
MAAHPTKSPHLARKFRVVGVLPGRVATPKNGIVDLRTISLELAEKLFAEGFPYLERIGAAPATTTQSAVKVE